MRGLRPAPRSEPDPYQRGLVAGVISVLLLEVSAVVVLRAYEWASTRPIIPDITAALTTPVLSVVDLFTLIFLVAVFFTIIGAMATLRGRVA